jgi:hypothetical protein
MKQRARRGVQVCEEREECEETRARGEMSLEYNARSAAKLARIEDREF